MAPPLKRLRRLGPQEPSHDIAEKSNSYPGGSESQSFGIDAEKYPQDVRLDIDGQGDPDMQLEQVRQQLDNKLKSKFEAIFDKYGKDFSGIGDEIDLMTGEIVVDNGHLQKMEDEMDDGTAKPSILSSFVDEAEDGLGSTEAEDTDMDEVDDSRIRLEDMEEDDMILFQDGAASIQRSMSPLRRSPSGLNNTSPILDGTQGSLEAKSTLPSEPEILAQFGQELGPKIAKYVSQQRVLDDSNIEPAWRTPGLPFATPGKRPILKSILLNPDGDRSPSPEGSASVWAPKRRPGRPRRDGANAGVGFRGETIVHDTTWYSTGYMSTTVTKQQAERGDQTPPRSTPSVTLNQASSSGEYGMELDNGHASYSLSPKDYVQESIPGEEDDASYDEKTKIQQHQYSSPEPDMAKKRRKRKAKTSHQSTSGAVPIKAAPIKRRAPRVPFTQADDDAVVEWIIEAQRLGYTTWSNTHWKLFEKKNPRHTYISWADRYRRCHYPKGIAKGAEKPIVRRRRRKSAKTEETNNDAPAHVQSAEDSHPEQEDYWSDGSAMEISQNGFSANDNAIPLRSSPRKDYGQDPRMEDHESMTNFDHILQPNPNLEAEEYELDQSYDPVILSHQNSRVDDIYGDVNIDPALQPDQNSWVEGMSWDTNIDPLLRFNQDSHVADTDPDENIDPALRDGFLNNDTLFGMATSTSFQQGDMPISAKPNNSNGWPVTYEGMIEDPATSHIGASVGSISNSRTETGIDYELPNGNDFSHGPSNPPNNIGTIFSDSIPNSSTPSVSQIGWNYDAHKLDNSPSRPKASPVLKQDPRNTLDVSYYFSDEDENEDIDSEQAHSLLRKKTPKKALQNGSVMPQSNPGGTVARDSDRLVRSNQPRQPPASDPASSRLSQVPAPLAQDFIPDLSSNSSVDLASPQSTASNAIQPETGAAATKVDHSRTNTPIATPTMGTPKSGPRAVIPPRKRADLSPSSSGSRTPGGSKRRCGESGFRCERDFCFKCMVG